jgi:hypothetical protein
LNDEALDGFRIDARLESNDVDFRIQRGQGAARGVDFGRADQLGAIEDLPLQVGEVDLVGVRKGDAAYAGGG